jgi:tetratricopeptide (TPR) repeat protein
MSGALRFGWAELAEPADGTFRSSVATLLPATASDSDRDALALLGEVAPTLLPVIDATADRRDPRAMGSLLAAYRAAARHDAARDFAAAIVEYRRVVEATPLDANAWHRLGLAAARLGRVDEALGAFERVSGLRPGRAEAAIEAARVEIDAGQLEAASARLMAALEALAPRAPARGRAAAHDLLAAIAATRKRPDEARAQAALAEKALPDVPFVAFIDARLAHDQDENALALAGFDAVIEALDGRPAPFDGLHWYRGDCLAGLDRHPEALDAFERAITEAPFDLRAYTSLATLQRASNRSADAVATVERLVRAAPTPSGYATAIRLSTVLGDRERAIQLRAEARQRFAGEPGRRLLPR